MFTINDDLSIYATRGDTVFFTVTAEENGTPYFFEAGDVLRMKIYGKKNATDVVLEKCFPVTARTDRFTILLTEEDTKIGDVISKPKDYWYEIELNPFTNPQTIIGYDEDGAKVFKLFPEGKDSDVPETDPEDIPVVDIELDMTSNRPVQNQAISRAIVNLEAAYQVTKKEVEEKANTVANATTELDNELAIERARIDNLISEATADDAELIDIRVGVDGVTYGTAGTAVRTLTGRAVKDTTAISRNSVHIEALHGATDEELAVIRAIRYIIPNGTDLSGYRLGVVQNNDKYPHALRFVHAGGIAKAFVPVKPDDYSEMVFENVRIGIDWDRIGEINNVYDMSHIQLTNGESATDYALHRVEDCLKEVRTHEQILDICGVPGKEVASSLTIANAWIRPDGTGIGVGENELFSVTVYPVEAEKVYVIHGKAKLAADVYPMAVFSEYGTLDTFISSKVLIDAGNVTKLQDYNHLFVPTVDGFIWVAEFMGYKVTVAENAGYSSRSIGLKTPLKVQLFGDSITDDYWGDNRTWATVMPDVLKECELTVINSAVGGSGIGHGHSGTARYAEKTYNHVHDLLTDGTLENDSDVVIVCVGTNNWAGSGMELGEWGDTTISTFYGAVRSVVEEITKNTDALLIMCTPPQRYNSVDEARAVDANGVPMNDKGATLRQFCDAFVETCKFYGVPCVDLHSKLGWNKHNIKKFCSDGLHPNNIGDEWIARIICNEIRYHCL